MSNRLYIINRDLFRYFGEVSVKSFWKAYFLIPGFRYMYWFRNADYYRCGGCKHRLQYVISLLMLRHYSFKYGIDIPVGAKIGDGFYIGHFSSIIVSCKAIIGKNVNISQGVTIGIANRGERKGVATIGDEVYIGPGAKIVGKIKIGNNVAIGANAVVTKDVPDNSVVVGIPAKVISQDGAKGYINNKVS